MHETVEITIMKRLFARDLAQRELVNRTKNSEGRARAISRTTGQITKQEVNNIIKTMVNNNSGSFPNLLISFSFSFFRYFAISSAPILRGHIGVPIEPGSGWPDKRADPPDPPGLPL